MGKHYSQGVAHPAANSIQPYDVRTIAYSYLFVAHKPMALALPFCRGPGVIRSRSNDVTSVEPDVSHAVYLKRHCLIGDFSLVLNRAPGGQNALSAEPLADGSTTRNGNSRRGRAPDRSGRQEGSRRTASGDSGSTAVDISAAL